MNVVIYDSSTPQTGEQLPPEDRLYFTLRRNLRKNKSKGAKTVFIFPVIPETVPVLISVILPVMSSFIPFRLVILFHVMWLHAAVKR